MSNRFLTLLIAITLCSVSANAKIMDDAKKAAKGGAAPKSASPSGPEGHPSDSSLGRGRHPVVDIPQYAAQLAPKEYLEARASEVEKKATEVLNSFESDPSVRNFVPPSLVPALQAVRDNGAKVLWNDVGKLNNLDKSVALDNLEAFVNYAATQYGIVSRGDYLRMSLDERSMLAMKLVAGELFSKWTPKTWKARDETDTILNGFGQLEAVRRSLLLKKTVRPPKAKDAKEEAPDVLELDLAAAVKEMQKLAAAIVAGIPKLKPKAQVVTAKK